MLSSILRSEGVVGATALHVHRSFFVDGLVHAKKRLPLLLSDAGLSAKFIIKVDRKLEEDLWEGYKIQPPFHMHAEPLGSKYYPAIG